MTITIEIAPDRVQSLQEKAARRGQDIAAYLLFLAEQEGRNPPDEEEDSDHLAALIERVRLTPERIAERQARTLATLAPVNPAHDGTNGMHRVVGQWPGDETEAELLAFEHQLDDEDAGRR